MCSQHLLGEHAELHKFLPSLKRGVKVNGRFHPVVQIQFQGYRERHEALAEEMRGRGFNHRSPMLQYDVPDFSKIYPQHFDKKVDLRESCKDLIGRCEDCRNLINLQSIAKNKKEKQKW
jgi:hypothetical protein